MSELESEINDTQGNPIREGFYKNINRLKVAYITAAIPESRGSFFYHEEAMDVSVRLTKDTAKYCKPYSKDEAREHINELRVSANFLESKLE